MIISFSVAKESREVISIDGINDIIRQGHAHTTLADTGHPGLEIRLNIAKRERTGQGVGVCGPKSPIGWGKSLCYRGRLSVCPIDLCDHGPSNFLPATSRRKAAFHRSSCPVLESGIGTNLFHQSTRSGSELLLLLFLLLFKH